MHELSVTQSLLDITLRHADGKRVTDIYLVMGQLSSFVDESVQFYWDMMSEGTLAEKARLHFQRIPAEMRCQDCDERFGIGREDFTCPKCGSAKVEVVAGDEFLIESIEVEAEGDEA
jgi:hydrogenase nickel incorporation protein HypA/HybF